MKRVLRWFDDLWGLLTTLAALAAVLCGVPVLVACSALLATWYAIVAVQVFRDVRAHEMFGGWRKALVIASYAVWPVVGIVALVVFCWEHRKEVSR